MPEKLLLPAPLDTDIDLIIGSLFPIIPCSLFPMLLSLPIMPDSLLIMFCGGSLLM